MKVKGFNWEGVLNGGEGVDQGSTMGGLLVLSLGRFWWAWGVLLDQRCEWIRLKGSLVC